MSELTQRTVAVVARTVGNTVSPAVAAMMTAASIATGNPELAAWSVSTGALAGSLTEEGIALVQRALVDRAERIEAFAEAAATSAEIPIDELLARAVEDRRVRQLLGEAVAAAASAHDDWKIRMLARAFVQSAVDPAMVDEMRILIDALRQIEMTEMRMFRLLAQPAPEKRMIDTTVTDLWYESELVSADPGIERMLPIIGLKLINAGLARNNSGWSLTEVGRVCAELLKKIGSFDDVDT